MDIDTRGKRLARPDSFSILETVDVHTGERTIVNEFDHVIEAPNWMRDGCKLIYNSGGCMYEFELLTGKIAKIDTGFALDCNNDHLLSPDNTQLTISHFTDADAASRIYLLPVTSGTPVSGWFTSPMARTISPPATTHPTSTWNCAWFRPTGGVESHREAVRRTGNNECQFLVSRQSQGCIRVLQAGGQRERFDRYTAMTTFESRPVLKLSMKWEKISGAAPPVGSNTTD